MPSATRGSALGVGWEIHNPALLPRCLTQSCVTWHTGALSNLGSTLRDNNVILTLPADLRLRPIPPLPGSNFINTSLIYRLKMTEVTRLEARYVVRSKLEDLLQTLFGNSTNYTVKV